ncbi:DUF5980 family protein [Streptomyces marincola]|uniref:DUF5980 family protein n=1 Tax=Streptomyces marincola TaxID=2878388 RepID=UPI001CF310B9|nr:DUF5980 family protein [Streptomyces marincola]UCM90581.1 hypothetical protein LC193_23050 [Streptomyces marincola]
MKATRRVAGLVSGLIAACMLTLVGATPASAATWKLTWYPGHEQRLCLPPGGSWPNAYFLASVEGVWTTDINLGIRDLPPGSYSDGGKIFASDWREDRNAFVGFVHVSIAPAPAGEYVAELWADDGSEVQTEPVIVSFSHDC